MKHNATLTYKTENGKKVYGVRFTGSKLVRWFKSANGLREALARVQEINSRK